MSKTKTKASDKTVYETFLIKKSKNGTKGLWFVLIVLPGNRSFITLLPVWKKIGANGLPENFYKEPKLFDEKASGVWEKRYIAEVRKLGQVECILPTGINGGSTREQFFKFLLA